MNALKIHMQVPDQFYVWQSLYANEQVKFKEVVVTSIPYILSHDSFQQAPC